MKVTSHGLKRERLAARFRQSPLFNLDLLLFIPAPTWLTKTALINFEMIASSMVINEEQTFTKRVLLRLFETQQSLQ